MDYFCRATIEALQRTSALCVVIDILHSLEKEKQWSYRLVPIFERHLLSLENCGRLLSCKSSEQMKFLVQRNQGVKIIFSLARMQLHIAESPEKLCISSPFVRDYLRK